ncbi:MAG: 5'-deoxynucleotidase [Bacillota bacterium]
MNTFFAYLNRMKYIERWALMRSTRKENIMEHSQQVAVIAHALAEIGNTYFGKSYDTNEITVVALFHECSEVITGDLPTPIKYYNKEINSAYKDLEQKANDKLIEKLPEEMRCTYDKILSVDKNSDAHKIMKGADKISAYIKCLEELSSGNKEFISAKQTIGEELANSSLEEVKYFMENFIETFEMTLDQLSF